MSTATLPRRGRPASWHLDVKGGRKPRRSASAPHLVRARPELSIKPTDDSSPGVMVGFAARFGEWARIESLAEGVFYEQISDRAFRRSLDTNKDRIKCMLSHGHHPQVSDAPLGKVLELTDEDPRGLYYAVELFDGVPPLVVNGIRAGEYGASFRFVTIKEKFTDRPGRSEHNPEGYPERILTEVKLVEFGPCPIGAYAGASAGMRNGTTVSLTDAYRKAAGLKPRNVLYPPRGPRPQARPRHYAGDSEFWEDLRPSYFWEHLRRENKEDSQSSWRLP